MIYYYVRPPLDDRARRRGAHDLGRVRLGRDVQRKPTLGVVHRGDAGLLGPQRPDQLARALPLLTLQALGQAHLVGREPK